ncbi:Hypothetical predicted protein [Paramuricea clavata]|uniref:Uncharacterized protein n=1 Tax=Paramuricea clavata TaxID=317549 RepID=A0A6S7I3N4_PARCT|nr:Hypothetical predicted protein [Paramuricea clavata]
MKIVETKNVIEKDPKEKEMVTVKEAGSARLKTYEHMLDDQETDDRSNHNKTENRKENPTEKKSGSQKKKALSILESDTKEEVDSVTSAMEKDREAEAIRVRNYVAEEQESEIPQTQSNVKGGNVQATVTEDFFKQLFKRLDGIQYTLDSILEKSCLESLPLQAIIRPLQTKKENSLMTMLYSDRQCISQIITKSKDDRALPWKQCILVYSEQTLCAASTKSAGELTAFLMGHILFQKCNGHFKYERWWTKGLQTKP